MTETKYHRIDLGKFDAEYKGQWVDIIARRTWSARLKVQAAYMEGIEQYKFAVLGHSVSRWSFDGPSERSAFEEIDEFVCEYIYDETVAWYAAGGRTPEESKRVEADDAGTEPGERTD